MARRASGAGEPQAEEVAERLHSAAIHLLRSARRDDPLSGLSPARSSALSVIVYAGPISLGDLAAAEQVRASTMTRLVAALEDAGWVEREVDTADRRVVRLRASTLGRRVLEAGRRRRVAHISRLLQGLTPRELATLGKAANLLLARFRPPR